MIKACRGSAVKYPFFSSWLYMSLNYIIYVPCSQTGSNRMIRHIYRWIKLSTMFIICCKL